jgi:hypothetical protein
MTHKITGEQVTDRVWEILRPQDQGQPKLVALLQALAKQQSGPMPMQPAGQVKPQAPPTAENIGASIATPPNPKAVDYPFIKRR